MSVKPPMKFEHDKYPIISTPDVDIEQYSKLRSKPYPQQSCKNLPYYFLEPEHPGPRICSSDLDKLPMHKFSQSHQDKLKGLYVSLREECGFKRYLLGEKKVMGRNPELITVYDCEISGSNFRIQHIKADIVQFVHYLTEVYNLNKTRFNSVMEVGLASAISSSSLMNCFGVATEALATGSNFYFFIWLSIFEFLVVRIQTYVHLTISNYANGTGLTAWGFCPYLKGMGVTLLLTELTVALMMFWETPLYFVKAWVASQSNEELMICEPSITFEETIGSYAVQTFLAQTNDEEPICYNKPTNYTKAMRCYLDSTGNAEPVFQSNYFYHYVTEMTNMSPNTLTVSKCLIYIATLLMWVVLNRFVKNGFDKMLQIMHHGAIIVTIFMIICFIQAASQMDQEIAKEATYLFFSLNTNFFNIKVILIAFKHATKQLIPYFLEFGSKMPHKWSPEAVFAWKASAHLLLHFFGMWLTYLAIFHEKDYYKASNISCFIHKIYLLNAAIPRFLNTLGFTMLMDTIYFLLDGYLHFILTASLVTIVWRNLDHHFILLKKYPQMQYVFDLCCLSLVVMLMFNVSGYRDYWRVLSRLRHMESIVLSVLVICIEVAVLTYYGPSRIWTDLEFLTRRRVPYNIESSLLVTIIVLVFISVLGLPRMLHEFLIIPGILKIAVGFIILIPSVINLCLILLSEKQSSEVRKFHFWGERSSEEQSERLRFNTAQFRTQYLRAKEINICESGDIYYHNQRQKALIRIAWALKQQE